MPMKKKVEEKTVDTVIGKVIASNGLNVRKAPNMDADIVKTLDFEEKVELLEQKHGWGKLKDGWVNLNFIIVE